MDQQYELTVIISNYNQEKHLAETVESVLAQKVKFPIKIIITDDCSCMNCSREIIKRYSEKYGNIEAILADRNEGYLANILRAKERTKTKFFCLVDADDYWTDRGFLQRAYDFLNFYDEYTIYEANVMVLSEDGNNSHQFVSGKFKSGTYSKGMFLNNQAIPVTQTTGMVFRNCIFSQGIPDIMKNAVGTRSERSFEGDTGRFIMHLKEGLAYYDKRVVGVYRITESGIWTSLSRSRKQIISARFYQDYYLYYGSDRAFFVNRAYSNLRAYLSEKQKELDGQKMPYRFIDEYERLLVEDVYHFCRKYEDDIIRNNRIFEKLKQIYRVIRS